MAKNTVTPDYGRSVRFRPERKLAPEYQRLRNWFTRQILTKAKTEGRVKREALGQILNAVDCLLANFLDAHRRSPKCFVGISLSEATYTKSRYFNRGFGYTNFKRVIDFMKTSAPPYVAYKDGFNDPTTKTGRVSRFIPSEHMLNLLNGYVHLVVNGNRPAGASRNMNEVVKDAHAYSQKHPVVGFTISQGATQHEEASDCIRLKDAEKRLKRYDDNSSTKAMRKELQRWNNFLVQHHIDLLLPDDQIENLYELDQEENLEASFYEDKDQPKFVEFERVQLYRVFNNGSFDEGGRFYGGWWQQIPREKRQFITINERATSEYDYSSLHPAMLYADAGLPLAGDAYDIDGIEPHLKEF